MDFEQKIIQLLPLINYRFGQDRLSTVVFNLPEYREICHEIAGTAAARNARTLAHPVDDLAAVFESPSANWNQYGSGGSSEDPRLAGFLVPSTVALIAIMGQRPELPYNDNVYRVLTPGVKDYLAVYGRAAASFDYDEIYEILCHRSGQPL